MTEFEFEINGKIRDKYAHFFFDPRPEVNRIYDRLKNEIINNMSGYELEDVEIIVRKIRK